MRTPAVKALVLGCLLAQALSASAGPIDTYEVAFDCLKIIQGERIVGFDIRLTAGKFIAFKVLPVGWDVNVDNDPSGDVRAVGGISVGAAALNLDQMAQMVVVGPRKEVGSRFMIRWDIVVTQDFTHGHLEQSAFSAVREAHDGIRRAAAA